MKKRQDYSVLFIDKNILNPAMENTAQVVNLHCAYSLVFSQSVNSGTTYIVLVY